MMSTRKKKARRQSLSEMAPVVESLERRDIPDAPLALSSDGVILADPAPDELLEPAAVTPPDAQSPDAAGLSIAATTSSCANLVVWVVGLSSVSEATASTPGYFRFYASACAPLAPPSVTVSYNRSGVATPDVDYTGLSGSVTIPLVNGFGQKDVAYYAVDDELEEPLSPESLVVTINQSADYSIGDPGSQTATVASNDYSSRLLGTSPFTVNRDGDPNPKTITVKLQLQKDGHPDWANEVDYTVVSVVDSNNPSQDSNAIGTSPGKNETGFKTAHLTDDQGNPADGIAQIEVTAKGTPQDGRQRVKVTVKFSPHDHAPKERSFDVIVDN